MEKKIKIQKKEVYKFSEKEREEIWERFENNQGKYLQTYWDYRDELSGDQIIEYINGEFEEYDLFDDEGKRESINNLINEELSDEELTDDELVDEITIRAEGEWDYNIRGLLRNSSVYLRVTLGTNEDFIYLPEYKKTETYKYFKKVFKDQVDWERFDEEVKNTMGTDYGHIVFYFKLTGDDIEWIKEDISRGYIVLKADTPFRIFNSSVGAGSDLDCVLKKDIKLNLKNWTNDKKEEGGYYEIYLENDKNSYGIQETYGLVGECWKEIY